MGRHTMKQKEAETKQNYAQARILWGTEKDMRKQMKRVVQIEC